jgi:hypothetical protein
MATTTTTTTTQPQPTPRAATLVFICPKCRSKSEGAVGSVNWCYCRTPAVPMRPLSAAERG